MSQTYWPKATILQVLTLVGSLDESGPKQCAQPPHSFPRTEKSAYGGQRTPPRNTALSLRRLNSTGTPHLVPLLLVSSMGGEEHGSYPYFTSEEAEAQRS